MRHKCDDCSKAPPKNAVVVDRYCNYSAFNGYHRTHSDYSSVRCMSCGSYWRTKADYVGGLPDANESQRTCIVK